jgi:magnesium transporter
LIVEKAQTLEIEMTDERTMSEDITEEMSNIKRSIITFLTAVWATHTTVHSLRYGDPEMLSDKDEILSRFDIILADLDRQIQLAEQVLQVLATGVNVIQTNITNRLSTIILWLTVMGTAVLVPNTLATVFAIIPNPSSMFRELLSILLISTLLASAIAYLGAKRVLGSKRRKK